MPQLQMARFTGRLASGILAALLLTACDEAPRPRGRVLLVGIDGASLRVALPLIRAGKLPHLAEIARAGVFGPLRSQPPLLSPRIWTTIATGKDAKKHGILSFAREDAEGNKRLYQSHDRKVQALWNIASDAGLRVAVVNWWTTYPLETIGGVIVSDHLLAREIQGRRNLTGAPAVDGGPLVYPEEWRARVASLPRDGERLTGFEDPFTDRTAFPGFDVAERMSVYFRDDEWIARIALEIEREFVPDLHMVFLPGIDRVSHHLWGALEPDSKYPTPPFTPEQRATALRALRHYYEYTDALIGLMVASHGPDDLVMVVSDHGFEAGTGLQFLTGIHEGADAMNGIIFARGPDVAAPADSQPVTVRDITPTILAWLGLPVGDDMDGRPANFLSVDPATILRIPTHDTQVVERQAPLPSGSEKAMMEMLRSLGYMQEEDTP